MRKYLLVFIVSLFTNFFLFATTDSLNKYSSELELINTVRLLCKEEFKMNISDSFYTRWSDGNEMYLYLYVSDTDSIKSPYNNGGKYLYYGYHVEEASKKKAQLDSMGYQTLLYKTYGTSATELTTGLLSYSAESMSYLAFHEATHQHIHKNGSIPYSLEEAACDIIGNYKTLDLFATNKKYSLRKAKKHIKQMENITETINNYAALVTLSSTEDFPTIYNNCKKELTNHLKHADQFKKDRYNYPINNAYFLRYESYCRYYFKLKQLYFTLGGANAFLNFIVTLPNNEEDAIKAINNKVSQ